MLPKLGSARPATDSIRWTGVIAFFLLFSTALAAQEASTGNLSGTIIGPRGGFVSGAKITLTQKLTGTAFTTITSPAGTYVLHDLPPGDYVLHVEAVGFQPAELLLRIQAAVTASGDVRLQRLVPVGPPLINTESPEVRSTQTSERLEGLPSSRNSFDLAFTTPGALALDGSVLAPSKSGVVSVSISGRSGRTSRILLDGNDISDETMGATAQSVALSSIQELKIEQSQLPLSSGLASAGAVSMVTHSGSDNLHGQLFGNFRDKSAAVANFPGGQDNPYSREVFGGGVGGALRKDKLFFFVSGEYFKQDLHAPVIFNVPFTSFDGSYDSPFHETTLNGRLDYKFSDKTRAFYRFTYDNNNAVNSAGGYNFQPFRNRANAPSHGGGVDFTTGSYIHSVRGAYVRYSDGVGDVVNGSSIFNPTPGVSLDFLGGPGFATGPNSATPQHFNQENKEVRYDGIKPFQSHSFRFGAALNQINILALLSPFSSAPQVGLDQSNVSILAAASGPFLGGIDNPLNYPVHSITLGNNLGCFSEKSAFGSACGGFSDMRLQGYLGDVWKILPNLTLTYGVQYVRDTGRNSSDLGVIPCSAVSGSFGALAPCSGSAPLLNTFGGNVVNLGDRVRQPNLNFGPQAGFAWDPGKSGRTVLRGGIGYYYDTSEFYNALFDREARLATGAFSAQANDPCASHGVVNLPRNVPLSTIDGLDIATQICSNPAGNVAGAIADLQRVYQAAFAGLGTGDPNPSFVGQILSNQTGLLAPNFQTPRSVQINFGFEHQFSHSTVIGVDYLRSITTHQLLGLDTNHVGDSGFLQTELINGNKVPTAALNAITATVTPVGCPAATVVGSGPGGSQTAVDCYRAAVPGASITDFARHGLDSGAQYLGGLPASVFGLTPDTGAAFAGINPLVGRSLVFFPAGRSLYSGLHFFARSHVSNPARGIAGALLQFSYSQSSYRSDLPGGMDQDLLPLAGDFRSPAAYFGSAPGDRKHTISSAAILDLPRGLRLSFVGNIQSPLPQTLFLPASGVPGEIFRTDITGDGSFGGQSLTGSSPFGDVLPRTNVGAFGRAVSADSLNTFIEDFNNRFAGDVTPAGESLINAGLLRGDQMLALGATIPAIKQALPGNVGMGWLHTFDFSLSWPLKVKDRFTFEPRVSAFNLFNTANFDGPGNLLSGVLNGQVGQINGTTDTNRVADRIGFGSGVFTQGAPRQLEFGLKVIF